MASVCINGTDVEASSFAFDGCHKIYVCESKDEENEACAAGYTILPIEKLEATYQKSCSLRFIDNWSLTALYCKQFEDACFTTPRNGFDSDPTGDKIMSQALYAEDELKNKIKDLSRELGVCKQRFVALDADFQGAIKERDQLRDEIELLVIKGNDKDEEIERLRREVAMANDSLVTGDSEFRRIKADNEMLIREHQAMVSRFDNSLARGQMLVESILSLGKAVEKLAERV